MSDDFKEIEKIFAKRDMNRYYENLDRAKRESVRQVRYEKKCKKVTIFDNPVFRMVPIVIGTLIITGSVTYASYNTIVKPLTDPLEMHNMSKNIGALVNEDKENNPLYKKAMSIVSQNTYTLAGNPAYDHMKIASDIINLDDPKLFDYALCCLYNDMGENVKNSITNFAGVTKTNIDWVIWNLKMLSSSESTEMKRYISSSFDGINTMEDYLIVNGYVDKNMNSSFKMFKEAMDEEAQNISNILDSNKGVHKNGI